MLAGMKILAILIFIVIIRVQVGSCEFRDPGGHHGSVLNFTMMLWPGSGIDQVVFG
jgi:hypothetical protein